MAANDEPRTPVERDAGPLAKAAADLLGVAVFVIALKLSRDWESSPIRLRLLAWQERVGDGWGWLVDRERFKREMRETLDTLETTEDQTQ